MRRAEDYIPDRIQAAAKAAGVKAPLMYLGRRDVITDWAMTVKEELESMGVEFFERCPACRIVTDLGKPTNCPECPSNSTSADGAE